MIRRIVLGLVAAGAIVAASAVAVLAAAFALYALLRDALGPAGAAAVVAGGAALLMVIGALICLLLAKPPKRKDNDGIAARALDLVKDKPVVALAAAAAAGFIAIRNPKLVSTAVTAFLAGKAADK